MIKTKMLGIRFVLSVTLMGVLSGVSDFSASYSHADPPSQINLQLDPPEHQVIIDIQPDPEEAAQRTREILENQTKVLVSRRLKRTGLIIFGAGVLTFYYGFIVLEGSLYDPAVLFCASGGAVGAGVSFIGRVREWYFTRAIRRLGGEPPPFESLMPGLGNQRGNPDDQPVDWTPELRRFLTETEMSEAENQNNDLTCMVCLDSLRVTSNETGQPVAIHCEHWFHEECIFEWASQIQGRCPLCRRRLIPIALSN